MSYGLPAGTDIKYGEPGFPDWVYQLATRFNLKASTYPGHQESNRSEKGFATNPKKLNRGIDFSGPVPDMQRFAEYLLTIKDRLEQVIWENPNTGQRVGVAGGTDVTTTPYYAADYPQHRDHVHIRVSQPLEAPDMDRPDFNEYPIWSTNCQDRAGTKIDLFLLHTEEGGTTKDGADRLAKWLGNPDRQVSYHYTVSQDPVDRGVTVVDVVDTDLASWSVLSANNRSINLCFAGSSVKWTTEQWMANSKALDAAAWLAAQDCAKYGIPTTVIAPPYKSGAGISDHAYVTKVLKDGTHSDVGPNFPWPYFASKVTEYAGAKPKPTKKTYPRDFTDRELLEDIWVKLNKLVAK